MAHAPGPAVRMEPIATLPVFLKLRGKRAVLAGGTDPAAWKAELLAAAGAMVEILAAEPSAAVLAAVADLPAGSVNLIRRAWLPADLEGAAVALGAIEDDEEAGRFQAAARTAGVPVNVIDKPAFCDFQFGTIVSRSPLVVGISTDGAAPVFGQAIRTRLEALLPQSFRAWAEAARDWRPAVQAMELDFRARRRFWETFASLALSADRAPSASDLDACRSAVLGGARTSTPAVTLVGAGPGSPGSVTLDAVRTLQDCDVVLHDPDVAPTIVSYARREAEKIALGDDRWPDPVAAIVAQARPSRRVAWLAGGSPADCLQTTEREALLTAAGLSVSKVIGLGRCRACRHPCPNWRSPPGRGEPGQASSFTG